MFRWPRLRLRDTLPRPLLPRRNQGQSVPVSFLWGDPEGLFTRQSSRSRRKAERKVGSGRKGTVDEEEYLLQSIVKMCARLTTIQGTRGNAKVPLISEDPVLIPPRLHPHLPPPFFFRRGGETFAAYAPIHGRASRRGQGSPSGVGSFPRGARESYRRSMDPTS